VNLMVRGILAPACRKAKLCAGINDVAETLKGGVELGRSEGSLFRGRGRASAALWDEHARDCSYDGGGRRLGGEPNLHVD
jgi:hypothetical protein